MTNADQPAFPWHASPGNQDNLGLTKREWLAGMAMQGFCLSTPADYETGPCNSSIVKRSIIIADALLAELEKKTT